MARSCSGVMRSATRYMRSRHDQKSSCSLSRRSARPAKARWKAWLCASTRPGSTGPVSTVACAGGATSGVTATQWPSRPISSKTLSRQPPGSQARGAQNRDSVMWFF